MGFFVRYRQQQELQQVRRKVIILVIFHFLLSI